jgi:hypothetical protein
MNQTDQFPNSSKLKMHKIYAKASVFSPFRYASMSAVILPNAQLIDSADIPKNAQKPIPSAVRLSSNSQIECFPYPKFSSSTPTIMGHYSTIECPVNRKKIKIHTLSTTICEPKGYKFRQRRFY